MMSADDLAVQVRDVLEAAGFRAGHMLTVGGKSDFDIQAPDRQTEATLTIEVKP